MDQCANGMESLFTTAGGIEMKTKLDINEFKKVFEEILKTEDPCHAVNSTCNLFKAEGFSEAEINKVVREFTEPKIQVVEIFDFDNEKFEIIKTTEINRIEYSARYKKNKEPFYYYYARIRRGIGNSYSITCQSFSADKPIKALLYSKIIQLATACFAKLTSKSKK